MEVAKTNARTKILKCIQAPPMVQEDTLESNETRVVSYFSSLLVASNRITAGGPPQTNH
jgi:hypothetical protein